MIPGPLGIRWSERLKPRLENAELARQDLATPERVRLWLRISPRIGDDIFLKLHGHGAKESNAEALLLKGGLDRLFTLLAEECRRQGHSLRYVSTWDMRRAVDSAAGGNAGPAGN